MNNVVAQQGPGLHFLAAWVAILVGCPLGTPSKCEQKGGWCVRAPFTCAASQEVARRAALHLPPPLDLGVMVKSP